MNLKLLDWGSFYKRCGVRVEIWKMCRILIGRGYIYIRGIVYIKWSGWLEI